MDAKDYIRRLVKNLENAKLQEGKKQGQRSVLEYLQFLDEARVLLGDDVIDDDEEAIQRMCDFLKWVKTRKGKKPPPQA